MTLYTPFVAPENFDKDSDNASLRITKREYFAGLAMQGLMSATIMNGEWTHDIKSAVEISVKAADALLKQLEQ